MKNYSLIKVDNSEYDWIVIAISYVSPIDEVDSIIQAIRGRSTRILFDLTLINGISSNRYISLKVDNGEYSKSSFRVVQHVTSSVKDVGLSYFANNPEVVDRSVLSDTLKHCLKQGILVE